MSMTRVITATDSFNLKTSKSIGGNPKSDGPARLLGVFRSNPNHLMINTVAGACTEYVSVSSIEFDGEQLEFNSPIGFDLLHSDLGWEGINQKLNVHEFGDSRDECISNIKSAVSFAWNEYAKEDDSLLDAEARKLANYLRLAARQ
ncbi:MAG TPA: hypothetical protein VNV60_05325 [Holophagaceae bacterium]|jgi:hypothetical protein|nr:hypothetical protein [Holophagaceae bacterium]